jgi:hypothetical protein
MGTDAVIPLVIPPRIIGYGGSISAGRPSRPDQQEWHPWGWHDGRGSTHDPRSQVRGLPGPPKPQLSRLDGDFPRPHHGKT